MNSFNGIGRLTDDINLRYTKAGTAVGSFTLATKSGYDKEKQEEKTAFIRCVVWGKTAENLAKFTRKGSRIGVTGHIETGSYENQKGDRVYTTDVNVREFDLLDSKGDSQGGSNSNQGNYSQSYQNGGQGTSGWNNDPFEKTSDPIDISDSDLPF